MQPDLSPEDCAAIAALLRDTIAADRFPMSPRIKRMRAILNKLGPPVPKPVPPLKPDKTSVKIPAKIRILLNGKGALHGEGYADAMFSLEEAEEFARAVLKIVDDARSNEPNLPPL